MTGVAKAVAPRTVSIATAIAAFLWRPASTAPLGLLRISVASVALVQLAVLSAHLLNLFGNFGLVQWVILEEADDNWLPSIGKLAVLFSGVGVSSTVVGIAVFAVYGVALLALLVGWRTRVAAVVAWLCHTLMVNSGYVSLYGVDTMLHICLFYFLFMPVGNAYSIDTRGRGLAIQASSAARVSLRLLQAHVCIIYLDAAFTKFSGAGWHTGEALWRALMQPQFAVYDFSWLAGVPQLAMVGAWAVMALQFTYVFAVWHPRLRRAGLLAIVSLHLAIALLMGLWLFSIVMIAMNFAAFGWDENRRETTPPMARRQFV